MTERECILYLLNEIKYKLTELETHDFIEIDSEILDSFHKYEKMKMKIIIIDKEDLRFLKIEITQKRFIENYNNNNKNGASWILWGGNKKDIEKGINEAESSIDYIMEVYKDVYKFDLR
ncbi:hypothetical protein [Flavobacterium geliluteum]|uniref:Uncharacterized protein n=1 Tax=Flavobacterium geliluteum TaxID=2816120 RepID=A0A940X917_9FLAO|nr:hypothetical protein [Flavobacterium geliluteum]MBP4137451.1 hypothetical protein [Flavobacterium geliluteum]